MHLQLGQLTSALSTNQAPHAQSKTGNPEQPQVQRRCGDSVIQQALGDGDAEERK